jgi:hypothetical protein
LNDRRREERIEESRSMCVGMGSTCMQDVCTYRDTRSAHLVGAEVECEGGRAYAQDRA